MRPALEIGVPLVLAGLALAVILLGAFAGESTRCLEDEIRLSRTACYPIDDLPPAAQTVIALGE